MKKLKKSLHASCFLGFVIFATSICASDAKEPVGLDAIAEKAKQKWAMVCAGGATGYVGDRRIMDRQLDLIQARRKSRGNGAFSMLAGIKIVNGHAESQLADYQKFIGNVPMKFGKEQFLHRDIYSECMAQLKNQVKSIVSQGCKILQMSPYAAANQMTIKKQAQHFFSFHCCSQEEDFAKFFKLLDAAEFLSIRAENELFLLFKNLQCGTVEFQQMQDNQEPCLRNVGAKVEISTKFFACDARVQSKCIADAVMHIRFEDAVTEEVFEDKMKAMTLLNEQEEMRRILHEFKIFTNRRNKAVRYVIGFDSEIITNAPVKYPDELKELVDIGKTKDELQLNNQHSFIANWLDGLPVSEKLDRIPECEVVDNETGIGVGEDDMAASGGATLVSDDGIGKTPRFDDDACSRRN